MTCVLTKRRNLDTNRPSERTPFWALDHLRGGLEGNLRVTERQQNGDPGRMGAGGGRGDQDLKDSGLLSGLTVGACHYTLVQTHWVSNTKSDPTVNHGLCVMTMCQSRGHLSGAGGRQRGGCACDGG